MKTYAAPMEGLTGFAWRKAHREVFGGADKYYTPFIVANQTHKFKTKELRDISQEEERLVPQILTDKAEHFIWAARELKVMGFDEVNFNLDCPSATVVTRGKGSGILRDAEKLDRILDEIYESLPDMNISIKTRVGFDDKDEWESILKVYDQYPVYELIIHSRLREEFYEGSADRKLFEESFNRTRLKLVYNGDIETAEDALALGWDLMAGRGLLKNPALFREIKGGKKAAPEELKRYHELLLEYYLTYMVPGSALHHMKSMWVYFEEGFDYDEKTMKRLRKAKNMNEYMAAAAEIMK